MDGFGELLNSLFSHYGLAGLAIFVLFIIVLLIVRGKFWPASMVRERLSDKQAIIDAQQQAIDKFEPILEQIKDTQQEQLEYARTTDKALHSIQEAKNRDGGSP